MTQAREDVGHTALVLFSRACTARIFSDDQLKAQLPGVTGGRFHADVSGDPAENNRINAAATQLKFQVGTVERAPLTFSNFDIAVLFAQRRGIGPPVFRQGGGRDGRIDRLF